MRFARFVLQQQQSCRSISSTISQLGKVRGAAVILNLNWLQFRVTNKAAPRFSLLLLFLFCFICQMQQLRVRVAFVVHSPTLISRIFLHFLSFLLFSYRHHARQQCWMCTYLLSCQSFFKFKEEEEEEEEEETGWNEYTHARSLTPEPVKDYCNKQFGPFSSSSSSWNTFAVIDPIETPRAPLRLRTYSFK